MAIITAASAERDNLLAAQINGIYRSSCALLRI
jgi:hypothetical protein